MTRIPVVVIISLVFAALLALSVMSRPAVQSGQAATQLAATPAKSGAHQSESDKNWVCPMHPEISQDHPGVCPICGMKLTGSHAPDAHEFGVHVDSATEQRLGVRLARVRQGIIGREMQTYGNVVAAENTEFTVQSRYEGWIKKLYVHAVGERVNAGQVLYEIYSPDLVARQRTYLSAIERRKQLLRTIQTTPDTENDYVMEMTMDAADDRLKLHREDGISIGDIQNIEQRKQALDTVKIVAARSGVVTELNVKEGELVMQTTVMMRLADTASVWVDVPLYPDQVASVHVGDPVSVEVGGTPAIRARIDFISPLAEGNKVHARIQLDNRHAHLRPGTFAGLTIRSQPHEALLLPRSAILYSTHGNSVMLARGDGHFIPVHVETGAEEGDTVELLDGLHAGAEVAVNGQFLLDAAAAMSAAAERMSTQRP